MNQDQMLENQGLILEKQNQSSSSPTPSPPPLPSPISSPSPILPPSPSPVPGWLCQMNLVAKSPLVASLSMIFEANTNCGGGRYLWSYIAGFEIWTFKIIIIMII